MNEQQQSADVVYGDASSLGKHSMTHERHRLSMQSHIEYWRPVVGVQPSWAIEVKIFCTKEMPQYEGYCTWDEEKFYAEMGLCCALSPQGLEWVMLTELCELQGYREGNWVAHFIEKMYQKSTVRRLSQREQVLRDYQYVRNQGIEERVQALMGFRRPFSLRMEDISSSSS